jgi:hypothetical protein
VPAATDRNALAIGGFRYQYPNPVDLVWFMAQYRYDAEKAVFRAVLVDGGGYDQSRPNFEANNNIQYTSVMAYPTPHIFYSIGGVGRWDKGTGEPRLGDICVEWLNYSTCLASRTSRRRSPPRIVFPRRNFRWNMQRRMQPVPTIRCTWR